MEPELCWAVVIPFPDPDPGYYFSACNFLPANLDEDFLLSKNNFHRAGIHFHIFTGFARQRHEWLLFSAAQAELEFRSSGRRLRALEIQQQPLDAAVQPAPNHFKLSGHGSAILQDKSRKIINFQRPFRKRDASSNGKIFTRDRTMIRHPDDWRKAAMFAIRQLRQSQQDCTCRDEIQNGFFNCRIQFQRVSKK